MILITEYGGSMKIKANKKLMIASYTLTITAAIMSVFAAFLLKMIIDSAMTKNMDTLRNSIYMTIVYIVAFFLINYIKEITIAGYIEDIMKQLKKSVYESIMNKNYRSFFEKSNGEYMSILTNDMTALEENYYKGIFLSLHSVICFLFALVSIFIINWKFALGLIGISLVFVVLTSFTGMGLNRLRVNVQNQMSEFTSKIKDLISGYEMIRSFNVQARMLEEFNQKNKSMEEAKVKFNKRLGITKVVNENLVILIVFAILSFGSLFVISGDLVIGSLIAVIQLLNNIMNPINILFITINNMKSTKSIREKIDVMITEGMKDSKGIRNKKLITKTDFQRSIKVMDLNFSYDGERNVIHDFNIEFEKGKKYAIVGESGCGKSTLLKLVQNYYDNYRGMIEIDNTDYKKIEEESFFNLFSVTHQNVFIFSGTIRENITLFNEYDKRTIDRAVKQSGLSKLVDTLPDGLDTFIHENGDSLSGGEKQRISIARALIKNTPILILDESTSALDKKTSDEVEREILSLSEHTCIAVTHKLNDETKYLYDSIIHLDNGKLDKIVEISKKERWA